MGKVSKDIDAGRDGPAADTETEIEVTPRMIDEGIYTYGIERWRLEDGDLEYRRIAITSIFRAMREAEREK
jgi:hypothetical protein